MMPELDERIVCVLRGSPGPLTAREIACKLTDLYGEDVSKKEVNQRLYSRELSAFVAKTEGHGWSLVGAEPSPTLHPIESATGSEPEDGSTAEPAREDDGTGSKEQARIVEADVRKRILVEAPPGTGKTYVACSRVASLVRDGVQPSQILLISFTRTAVAEIRDRIARFLDNESNASRVRISTIDSNAWQLRVGFEAAEVQRLGGSIDFDTNLERAIDLLSEGEEQICAFVTRLRHVVVDEAQDVVGIRAEFLRCLLRRLNPECGVTVLADPYQAIYGFTNDENDSLGGSGASFMELLRSGDLGAFESVGLSRNFRTTEQAILSLIDATRRVLRRADLAAAERLRAMHQVVREGCLEAPVGAEPSEGTLVLYRRRAEVLMASSYLSGEGIEHRLRLSGLPLIVQPWIGRLLSRWTGGSLTRSDLESLWADRYLAHLFGDLQPDQAWRHLHRLAGDGARVELSPLRRVLSRSRPPVEICVPESGLRGPILGTIHASKGREAPNVRLMLPRLDNRESSTQQIEEECRVVYVAATRAISRVEVGRGFALRTSRTRGRRLYRRLSGNGTRAQIEIGLSGDVSMRAHAGWPDAAEVQNSLAELAGSTRALTTRAMAETGWRHRLFVADRAGERCVGEIGERLLREIWVGRQRPSHMIPGIYMIGATTTAVSDDEDVVLQPPLNQSRIFLAPVVKAFTTVYLQHGAI